MIIHFTEPSWEWLSMDQLHSCTICSDSSRDLYRVPLQGLLMCLNAQSCLTLGTPWTVAHQAPPSMGFPRQEYWSRVPLPSRCVELSLGFLFCSIDLYFCLFASTILSWWLWLCSRAWSQAGWFLQFHSSFSRCFGYSRVLYFHTNCEIICSSSVKNMAGSLIGIALNL